MRFTIRILQVVCALLCFLPWAAPGKAFSGEKKSGMDRDWVRIGVHVGDAGTFDPHLAKGSQDRAVADMLFNGLLRYVPGEAPSFEPDLAAEFPVFSMRNNHQVWTVHLKQEVRFHAQADREPEVVSADDVVFSFQKAADPLTSAYASEYRGMRFEKVDTSTVRIIVEEPLSPLLFFPKISNYSGGFIVSKQAIQDRGYARFAKHPVGSGPFRFQGYIPGERVVLAAHDRYFRGRPQVRGVIVRYMPRLSKREAAFRSGELDLYVGSGDPAWVEKVRGVPGHLFDVYGVGEVMTLHLNTSKSPLDDHRVRRALLLALDRDAFVRTTSPVITDPAYAPVPEDLVAGGLSAQKVRDLDLDYAFNLQKARGLLADAGYAQGFPLRMIVSEKRIYRSCAKICRQQLQRIKVDCTLEIVPHHEMHRRIRNDESDLVLYGAWRPTADAYLTQFFHSDSMVGTRGASDTNFSHYTQVDGLLEAACREVRPRKQIQLWSHAQIRILSDAVAYPLFSVKQNCVRRPDLEYEHPLTASMALYPQVTEKTRFAR